MRLGRNRRDFLKSLSAAGAVALLGARRAVAATITLTGDQGWNPCKKALAADTTINAYGAVWHTQQLSNPLNLYPVRVRDGDNCRWNGGAIKGHNPLDCDWATAYSKGNSCGFAIHDWQNTSAMQNFVLNEFRVDNGWDGPRPDGSPNFTIQGCWFSNMHDDAVENDQYNQGTIRDCLFDHVFSGVSCQNPGSSLDGSGRTVTLDGVIFRNGVFCWNGHRGYGKILKWHSRAPKINLLNSTFILDRAPITRYGAPFDPFKNIDYGATFQNKVVQSSGNRIVWTGSGSYPYPVPPGFTLVVQSASHGQSLVDTWVKNHPNVARI
jgi:hypothetical protein